MHKEDCKIVKKAGKYLLARGDCLELMKNIKDNSIDLVLCDPPYGINFQSRHRKNEYNKIVNDNSLNFIDEFFAKIKSKMKQDTHTYIFCSWHNVNIFKQCFEKHFVLKNILVWVKNNHGMGDLKATYAPKYELCLFGHKGRRNLIGKRKPDVMNFSITGNRFHPTEKPVEMMEYLIQNSTNEGEVVFDGFMGSGTTGVACMNTNRKFIGIEKEKQYFDISVCRIKQAEQMNK